MKVLFGIRHNGADSYYRARAPASVLRYNGVEVECRAPSFEDAVDFDVLVLQRHCSPAAELLLREFQSKGKPVIYDVDDWLRGMPPFWPAYDTYWQRGIGKPTQALRYHERIARAADMITCTTAPLAERMLGYNDVVRVVPNCIMWADWDTVIPSEKKPDARPTIGWFGLPYYWDTWREMHEALEQAVMDTEADLAILGYPEATHMLSDIVLERTWVEPMTTMSDFHKLRRMIVSFDVGIAWVKDTKFNRCKSPLKALQYGAAGVPVVASNACYSEVLSGDYPGEYGTWATTPEMLYHELIRVIEHPEAAGLQAAAWQQRVFEHHSYETQWQAWDRVLVQAACL